MRVAQPQHYWQRRHVLTESRRVDGRRSIGQYIGAESVDLDKRRRIQSRRWYCKAGRHQYSERCLSKRGGPGYRSGWSSRGRKLWRHSRGCRDHAVRYPANNAAWVRYRKTTNCGTGRSWRIIRSKYRTCDPVHDHFVSLRSYAGRWTTERAGGSGGVNYVGEIAVYRTERPPDERRAATPLPWPSGRGREYRRHRSRKRGNRVEGAGSSR